MGPAETGATIYGPDMPVTAAPCQARDIHRTTANASCERDCTIRRPGQPAFTVKGGADGKGGVHRQSR